MANEMTTGRSWNYYVIKASTMIDFTHPEDELIRLQAHILYLEDLLFKKDSYKEQH